MLGFAYEKRLREMGQFEKWKLEIEKGMIVSLGERSSKRQKIEL